MRTSLFSVWIFSAFLVSATGFATVPCLSGSLECSEFVELRPGFGIQVYRNLPLQEAHPDVKAAVLVVHGVLRNANEYFQWVATSAKLAGASENTLILAPFFKNEMDSLQGRDLYWHDEDWKRGEESLNCKTPLSSFSVVDEILHSLPANFPNLRRITVTGHSAGGQFASRYVATSPLPDLVFHIDWHFVIGNPSSYFYLDNYRPRPDGAGFDIPEKACPDYDEYPYGLVNPNPYVAKVKADQIQANVRARSITLFLGEDDTGTELLDQSCGANLQGKNRFERGSNYYNYLKDRFPPKYLSREVVIGVGHSGELMYQSKAGQQVLFQ